MTFNTGKTYFCRFACDSEMREYFTIERRTTKSIWTKIDGKIQRRSIFVWNGVESFKPFGSYSMAPIVTAEREVEDVKCDVVDGIEAFLISRVS